MNYKVKIVDSPLLRHIRLDKIKSIEDSTCINYLVFDTDTYNHIDLSKLCGSVSNIKKEKNHFYCNFEVSDTNYGKAIKNITNEIYYEFIPFEINNELYFAISYSPPF